MTQKIKPCPFCRGEKLVVFKNKNLNINFIECDVCMSSGPSNELENVCIEEWNRVSDLVHKNINQQKEQPWH